MLDFTHLPQPGVDFQEFYGTSQTTLIQYQTWRKPRGAKMLYIICVGGGASGGTGSNNLGSNSGGGAGGGSGAQSTVLIPAALVPDVLYIQAGRGGASITANTTAGAAGVPSYVLTEPLSSMANACCLAIGAAGAAGGTVPTVSAGGVAGTAAAVPTIGMMPLAGRGVTSFFAGQQGSAGGATGIAGTALALPVTGLIVSGGAGGGGSAAAGAITSGGQISSAGLDGRLYPLLSGGQGAVTPPNSGQSMQRYVPSYGSWFATNWGVPLILYGGSGGASANNVAGQVSGSGGDGMPGCGGGGGGGSGTGTASAVGRSGAGGPGFVWIFAW